MEARARLNELQEELVTAHGKLDDCLQEFIVDGKDVTKLTGGDEKRVSEIEVEISRLKGQVTRARELVENEPRAERRIKPTDIDEDDGLAPPLLTREQRMADVGHYSPEFRREDVAKFSLGRLVRGMVTGSWEDAALERRALSEGTNTAGGFLTPEPLSNFVIDRIRNVGRVFEAGARTLRMDSDSLSIPRLTTGVSGAWRAENAAVNESDPAFDRVTFTPRTLAVLTRLSYELFQDMTPEGAAVIETELIQALAIELDRVALRGTGTPPEPKGVLNHTGVTTITNGANGTAMTWDMLIAAMAAVQAAGFDPNASILAPRATKSLALTKEATTNAYLAAPPYVAGHELLVTNQIPINLTTGTSSDTSEIYTGQWDQLLIGFRPQVSIQVQQTGGQDGMVGVKTSQERYIDSMQIGVLAFLRADVQVLHGEAFAVSTGVRP